MRESSSGRLAAALAALENPAQVEDFLRELLTPTEFHDFALRWELMELLASGVSQRQVATRLGVSLCKITRGARILKEKGVIASIVQKHSVKAVAQGAAQAEAGKAGTAHGTRVTRKSED